MNKVVRVYFLFFLSVIFLLGSCKVHEKENVKIKVKPRSTKFLVNNFVTSFKYLSDSNSINNRSYISNTTKYSFDRNNSFGFTTNKNLDSNLTEYYDLVYEYKNDCLKASVEYKKTFYDDVDLDPDENIFFSITIIPFGSINTPNLR